MEKYRITIENINGNDDDLGELSEGIEVEGFVLLTKNGRGRGQSSVIMGVTPVDLATLFAGEGQLIAAAKAGEQFDAMLSAKRKSDFERKMKGMFSALKDD